MMHIKPAKNIAETRKIQRLKTLVVEVNRCTQFPKTPVGIAFFASLSCIDWVRSCNLRCRMANRQQKQKGGVKKQTQKKAV
jgi:hypothetical protein